MTYELAKKLKDAGFPQKHIFPCEHCGDDPACLINKHQSDKGIYFPTLSELIEACGEKGFVMWELDGIFYAAKDDNAGRGDVYYDDYPSPLENGKTPEEAVANLWLELKRKI